MNLLILVGENWLWQKPSFSMTIGVVIENNKGL
jgi:hypothetical protein